MFQVILLPLPAVCESRAGRRITARKMIETNWIKLRKEKHTKKKKMMKRLEGLNDEERLKELNMDRLAKCRLEAAIRTVYCICAPAGKRGRTGRCGVRQGGGKWAVSK